MSGSYPLFLDMCNGVDYGSNTSSSSGFKLTAPTSTNTKGAYTQLTSSTTNDASYMLINMNAVPSASSNGTVGIDISVGAAASEKVIVQNLVLPVPASTTETSGANILIPIQIPSGTRVAARWQGSVNTVNIDLNIQLFDSGFTNLEGVAGVDSVGFSTSTSQGTAITPSTTAGTKGSYAQLIASTTRDYIGFFLGFDVQGVSALNIFGQSSVNSLLMDLAIGGSGSEKIIIPNLQLNAMYTNALTGTHQIIFPCHTPIFPINIPSGTRVAARAEAAFSGSGAFGVTLYGLYQ